MFGQIRARVGYEWERLMNAGRIAVEVYRDEDRGIDSPNFDTLSARMERYRLNTAYADGKQYRPANVVKAGGRYTKRYRHTRNIYNFINRLIDLEVNKIYGGRIDWTGDLRTGAIPIIGAEGILLENIKQILEWSNFGDGKELYVRNGSLLGDSFLKVIPVFSSKVDPEGENVLIARKVRIEILDPHKVKDIEHDSVGNVIWICIEYEDIGDDGKPFMYREEISKFDIKIYREKELMSVTPNGYGFVPVVHVKHKNIGRKWGITSFHTTLEKIDEINDVASNTNDGIRKAAKPLLATTGGRMGQPDEQLRERDDMLVVELPKEGSIQVVTPSIDVTGFIAAQDKMTSEAEADVPQTSLQRIREKNAEMSGKAIENSYSDASDTIEALQGNYDERLIRAIQMALTMAGVMGLPGFEWIDIETYDAGLMRFYIKERKVFSDQLDKVERARLLIEAAQSPVWSIVARDLEVSEEDIELVLNDGKERQALQTAAAIRGLMQGAGMDEDETEEGQIEEESEETEE